jgi:hypothetical protein
VAGPKQRTTHDALKVEDYEKVVLGVKMTVAEVEQLLGPGLTEPPEDFQMRVGGGERKPDYYRWWWDGENGIVVAFIDDKVWMKGTSLAGAQVVDKEPAAIVTITGSRELTQQTTVGGKTTTVVVLRLDESSSVRAQVNQTFETVEKLAIEDAMKRLARDKARLEEAEKAGDTEKAKKLRKEYLDNAASYVKSRPMIVEGTLVLSEKQLSLSGVVRPLDAADKPEAPPLGSVLVEGEALPGEHAVGKEQKSPLAIKNGASPIIVTGNLAKENSQAKGRLRVSGRLRVADNGALVVDADRVEPVTKKE